jgi:DNA polymerase-3 subunit alpha
MTDRIVGFEHLHRHTCFSLLDGYAHPEEYAKYSSEINQKFLCISDHGMMAAIPRQIKACEKFDVFPLFACELYLNPMQPEVRTKKDYEDFMGTLAEEEKKYLRKSFHLLAVAHNEVGYANLVHLSSRAWTHGLGGRPKRPRINHQDLLKYKEGITFSSACYNGEIGQAFDGFCCEGGDEDGFRLVELYKEMLGEHFYLELMLLDFNKQKPYDEFLVRAHDKYGIPLVLTNDTHYCYKEDSKMQQLMLMIQTNTTVADLQTKLAENPDADLFELQDTNLWMKSEEEINEKWEADYSDAIPFDLFTEAKKNTVRICEKAKGVELDRTIKLPEIPDADDAFKEAIKDGFQRRMLPKSRRYLNRIKEEYELICRKGFSSYFLIQKQMIDEARRVSPRILGWGDGSEAVGPGRGSVCSSLAAYCLGLHDIDPIKHDLLFSRFLSESRGGRSIRLKFKNLEPIKK